MKKKICILLVFCLLVPLSIIEYKHLHYQNGLAILGYHNIVSDEQKANEYKNDIYSMSLSKFEKQMACLYEQGYHTLTLDEVYDWYYNNKEIPEKSVVITFDDGRSSFNKYVKEIMEKYQFHATCFAIGFFTITDPQGTDNLSKEDMVDDDYVSYYSHSFNMHSTCGLLKKKIETMSKEEIEQDFDANQGLIDATYFAYPYGRSTKIAREVLVEKQVKLAFGYGQNRKATKQDDPYLLPRFLMYSFMNEEWFKYWLN